MKSIEPPRLPSWQRLRRRFVWSLVAGIALYAVLAIYGDVGALREVLGAFPWRIFPLVIGLTLVNYAGRLLKWILYLRWLGAEISARDAARVFGVGMTMVLTPGKAGELLKSWMVKQLSGTPMRVTAPAVLAERLTDGLAMLLLSGLGLLAFDLPELRRTAIVLLVIMLAAIVVTWIKPLARWGLELAERLPVVGSRAHHLHDFYDSSYVLLRPPALLAAVGIGLVSWTCEGLAYYLVLTGVGVEPSLEAAGKAIFIFSISTIVGAVVATPGGLGGTEGGLVTLGMRLLELAKPAATAAALLVRLATLWFGVALGLVCMALWPELLAGGGGKLKTSKINYFKSIMTNEDSKKKKQQKDNKETSESVDKSGTNMINIEEIKKSQTSLDRFLTPERENDANKKRKVISPIDLNESLESKEEITMHDLLCEIKGLKKDIDSKFDLFRTDLLTRVNELEGEVKDLSTAADEQRIENDELKKDNEELRNRLLLMEGRITRTEKHYSELHERVLDTQAKQMCENLVFYNIPESHSTNENVYSTLESFFRLELRIKEEEISEIKADFCHRLGKRQDGKMRPIIAKFNTTKSRVIIRKHQRNLAGKRFFVREQIPREYEERRKQLQPLQQAAKEQNKRTRWTSDKLVIEDKVHQIKKDTVNDINIDTTAIALQCKVIRAPPRTYRNSTFQGSAVRVINQDEIIPALQASMKDVRTARSSHMIYAYRIKTLNSTIEHYEDDNEFGAGKHLLAKLKEENIIDTLICVTRWHQGPNLGSDRFKYIKEACDIILEQIKQ